MRFSESITALADYRPKYGTIAPFGGTQHEHSEIAYKVVPRQICDNIIYFENRTCGRCGYPLAYIPELEIIAALEPADGDGWTLANGRGLRRFCANADYDVCNWLTDAESKSGFVSPEKRPSGLVLSVKFCRADGTPAPDEDGAADVWGCKDRQ